MLVVSQNALHKLLECLGNWIHIGKRKHFLLFPIESTSCAAIKTVDGHGIYCIEPQTESTNVRGTVSLDTAQM